METDVDTAADRVIGITNAVGAAAANVQNSRQAAQTARQILSGAARRPNLLGAAGAAMIATAAVLKLRESSGVSATSDVRASANAEDADPSQSASLSAV